MSVSNLISNCGISANSDLHLNRLYESDSDHVLPEAYGAVGDGSTDDTAAFQQALATGKIVRCLNKTYAVKDLQITTNQTLQGEGTRLVPITGSKFCVELSGFNPAFKDMRVDDFEGNIVRKTYASSVANIGATSISVNDPTGFEEGMIINIRLNNGTQWSSVISGVVGNVVSFREQIWDQVSIYREVNACYALVKVGNSNTTTLYWKTQNLLFVNCSSAIYIANNSSRGTCENITIGDLRYNGINSIDEVNDNAFLNIRINGGHNVQQNFTGTGVKVVFDISIAVNLLRDLSVYVDNVLQTEGVDYTFNSATQIQFAVAPADGALVRTVNFLDASVGFYVNGDFNNTPYLGTIENLLVLDCDYGMRLRKSAGQITDVVLDTVGNGVQIDNQGTGVPLVFCNALIGFYTYRGIDCKNNTANPSFVGSIYTKATPTSFLPPGATLGYMINVEAGSNLYIDRNGWVNKDAETQIVATGNVYYTGGNSVKTIDGSSALPSYTFGSAPTKGFYKFDAGKIGVAGNIILNDNNASLNLGNLTSTNPSINFFTSNTGSYNTPSSRIQAYGGSGSGNSGTIEINSDTFKVATGVSGNTNVPILVFSNFVNCSNAIIQNVLQTRDGDYATLYLNCLVVITASTEGSFQVNLPLRTTNFANTYSVFASSGYTIGTTTTNFGPAYATSVVGDNDILVKYFNGTENIESSVSIIVKYQIG